MTSNALRAGDRILFQGDSITDANRLASPELGDGYVAMVAGVMQAMRPDLALRVLNRGVSGDRSAELLERWKRDCIDLKPDVVSIMVGVNDVWRLAGEWNGQTHISLPPFRMNYVRLLDQVSTAGVRQVFLVSPTTITHENASPLNDLLGEYDDAVRDLARQYGAVYVPAREALLAARTAQPEVAWTTDGCHPGTAGHALIAACWLRAAAVL